MTASVQAPRRTTTTNPGHAPLSPLAQATTTASRSSKSDHHLNSDRITPVKSHNQNQHEKRTTNSPWSTTTTPSKSTSHHDPKTPPAQTSINSNNGTTPTATESSKKSSSSKVSHVICKFYKAGNCSAGTTCQFSHTLPEVGQGKPVCQWFVKGNCRFAHKCALAHILPGQPMSMDRKNKRAAQAAAREAAAASASALAETSVQSSSPPELVFEPPDSRDSPTLSSQAQINTQPTLIEITDSSLLPESPTVSRRKSSVQLISGHPDLEGNHHASDELQFGLPDDFVHSNGSFAVHPNGYSLLTSSRNPLTAILSPNALQPISYFEQQQRSYASTRQIRSEHNEFSVESSRPWPREQSPGPFGAGSPFSAPGSRSIFLPRLDSSCSDDGFPRSVPSAAASPRHAPYLSPVGQPIENDIWDDHVEGGRDDVTELLPSSLHSLLTPEERHRQHLRKLVPPELSRSVPIDHLIANGFKPRSEAAQARSLRAAMTVETSLSVSPAPVLSYSSNRLSANPVHQRETSASTIRPQPTTYLSSSYVPPATHFGNWEASHFQHSTSPSTLSPPLTSNPHELSAGPFNHAPGTSLPQGLAAGLSRLHFQPPLPTGLTPCGSPPTTSREHPLSPPRSPPASTHMPYFPSALSQRMAGLHFGSTAGPGRPSLLNNSSPLSRNVSYSPGSPGSPTPEDDDAPFRLEI